jgi:tRNA A37 threonylcarbamoyladenosine dehydratase
VRDATVVILGCGGLGTWALAAPIRGRVGGFVLVDDDCLDLSNLNRQILYDTTVLGA